MINQDMTPRLLLSALVLALLAIGLPARGAAPPAPEPKTLQSDIFSAARDADAAPPALGRVSEPTRRAAQVTGPVRAPSRVIDPAIDPSALPTLTLAPTAPAPPCSWQKLAEVLADAPKTDSPESDSEVKIDCSLKLDAGFVITKRLIFEGPKANGVTVACNGATISGAGTTNDRPGENWKMVEIRSSPDGRASNITLRNCNIYGSVGVHLGYGFFDYEESMRRAGHAERVRSRAPQGIVFDNVTITARGYIPLYIYSGVTKFQLLNSKITGDTNALNIYLDAESSHNTFRNNIIEARLTGNSREVMAIDGSSDNVIINNRFSSLDHGGIYLYRNDGEGGTIRHTTPSRNIIVNNVFYYRKYDGPCPAIYVGSRSNYVGRRYSYYSSKKGDDCQKDKGHGDKDKGYRVGSSASDFDHAQFNVVMQNQFYRPQTAAKMIKVGRPDINTPNYIEFNDEGVTEATEIKRKAGCFVKNGYPKHFILDGEVINRFHSLDALVCDGHRYACDDGALIRTRDLSCTKVQLPADLPQFQLNDDGP